MQGAGAGFLAHPDDAYMVAGGQQLMVADIINCRVLWLNHARHVVHAIGSAGDCAHDPPRALLQPNGDTPLPDGGVLVTEIGGWVDRFTASGKLMWSIKTPTNYPSDAQLLANGDVLVAGFNSPGSHRHHHAERPHRVDLRADIRARRARPTVARRASFRTARSPPPTTGTIASW